MGGEDDRAFGRLTQRLDRGHPQVPHLLDDPLVVDDLTEDPPV